MEPAFMYWSEIKFNGNDNFKEFTVNFNDEDNLNGVMFKKEKNYFITSLTDNVEIEKNLKKLKDHKKIQELSEKSNEIIEKGVDHLHKDFILEINLKDIDIYYQIKQKGNYQRNHWNFLTKKLKKRE